MDGSGVRRKTVRRFVELDPDSTLQTRVITSISSL
jgi:hypothetical protein